MNNVKGLPLFLNPPVDTEITTIEFKKAGIFKRILNQLKQLWVNYCEINRLLTLSYYYNIRINNGISSNDKENT